METLFLRFGGIRITLLVNSRKTAHISTDRDLRAVYLAKRIRRHVVARKRNHPVGFAFCDRGSVFARRRYCER